VTGQIAEVEDQILFISEGLAFTSAI